MIASVIGSIKNRLQGMFTGLLVCSKPSKEEYNCTLGTLGPSKHYIQEWSQNKLKKALESQFRPLLTMVSYLKPETQHVAVKQLFNALSDPCRTGEEIFYVVGVRRLPELSQ